MQHEYTLFNALDESTVVKANGCTIKKSPQQDSSHLHRTLAYISATGKVTSLTFGDQNILLDNEGYGEVFDNERSTHHMQFGREVFMPLPLLPFARVPPTSVQELITTCLTAMGNMHEESQWLAFGISLSELQDRAAALGVAAPRSS